MFDLNLPLVVIFRQSEIEKHQPMTRPVLVHLQRLSSGSRWKAMDLTVMLPNPLDYQTRKHLRQSSWAEQKHQRFRVQLSLQSLQNLRNHRLPRRMLWLVLGRRNQSHQKHPHRYHLVVV